MVAHVFTWFLWGADSGAYFVGRKLGKKIAPDVSPNKSVEGLYGGIVTAMIIVVAVEVVYLDLTLAQHILFFNFICSHSIQFCIGRFVRVHDQTSCRN